MGHLFERASLRGLRLAGPNVVAETAAAYSAHAPLPFDAARRDGRANSYARLARALINPTYSDDDAWVAKGRALFALAQDRLSDSAIGREIGGVLGNDPGQMRVQFNVRTHVVEPAYRDRRSIDAKGLEGMPDASYPE